MDEAVGHANRIEVELKENYEISIRDNGRGVPIDPHPKYPDKSALEVIFAHYTPEENFQEGISDIWRITWCRRFGC